MWAGRRESRIWDPEEWILAQDPRKADSPYSGNVYLQREARELLANIDDYF